MISEEVRRALADVGLDTEEMTARFMDNEAMFVKYFLKFFPSSEHIVEELRIAVRSGDLEQIERTAHALKGLAGNIGLTGVYLPAQKIVNDLRAGKTDSYALDFMQAYDAYAKAFSISKRIS
ncbi:MAG: Hpt domain-containing protein [Oscillospiraceae bacterium]